MLFLDGVYVEHHDKARFRRVSAPFKTELEVLVRQISERVGWHLERTNSRRFRRGAPGARS